MAKPPSRKWRKVAGSMVRGEAWKQGMGSKGKKKGTKGKKSQKPPVPIGMEEFHKRLIENARKKAVRDQNIREQRHSLSVLGEETRHEIVQLARAALSLGREIGRLEQQAQDMRASGKGIKGEIKKNELNIGGCRGKIKSLLLDVNEIMDNYRLERVSTPSELVALAKKFANEEELSEHETIRHEKVQPPAPAARQPVPKERIEYFRNELLMAARDKVSEITELHERVRRSVGSQRDMVLSEQEKLTRALKEMIAKHNKLAVVLGKKEISIHELEKEHEELVRKEKQQKEKEEKERERKKKEAEQKAKKERQQREMEKVKLAIEREKIVRALRKRYPGKNSTSRKTTPTKPTNQLRNPRNNLIRNSLDAEILQLFPTISTSQDREYAKNYWEKINQLPETKKREAMDILGRILMRKKQGRIPAYHERVGNIIGSLERDLGKLLGE